MENQNLPWSDTNRFNQTGYSAPTVFPQYMNYNDPKLWEEDMKKAELRENSHQEWKEDERWDRINNGRR